MPGDRLSSLSARLWQDTRRVAAISLLACLLLALFELVAALITTPAPDVRVVTVLRLALIDVTLIALLWGFLLLPALLGVALGARLFLYYLGSPERALAWPGLFSGLVRGGVHPALPWLWAGCVGAAVYIVLSSYLTFRFITHFKEPKLTALLLSLVQIALVAGTAVLARLLCRLARRAAHGLDSRLGPGLDFLNPLGRVAPAALVLAVAAALIIKILAASMPQFAPLVPWRHLLAAAVLALGCHGVARIRARRGSLAPAALRTPRARRMALYGGASVALFTIVLTLVRVGADHEAKSVAMTGSPLLQTMADLLRRATDFDGDGFGFLLGENDCAPFNKNIHPLAREIPDNGIDEDCNGRDFSFASPPRYRPGERMTVPEEFLRDWNILLITVDTVRYDHTGFGGYIEQRGRDTTPNLDRLVERSVSFTFANAPSAGTMASIPAILTSRFFHSGIALEVEGVKPRMPPRLRPENLLIAEILKEQGYYNGAILSHEYFNDWGMEQGFDTYDNEIGKVHAPFKVTSHEITDKAIAWIARNSKRDKWFLWAHYLDPHGRYVAHPGERSFGTTEEDLYDGELYYTDKHLGRLFKELSRMPGADRTIIIITSDHGDGFGEHGFTNHGFALYREVLHVPLIFYIPGLPARTVDGAVSPIDIVPTVCDLVGVDPSGLDFEGESLVPQLFYGKDAHHRVVFAETDAPRPIRAAITSKYKLIYKLKENIYELYDLEADPWEKRNIYNRAGGEGLGSMKEYLDHWLERVYYSRDVASNQAASRLQDVLLTDAPSPTSRTPGMSFDEGRIEVIGFDTDKSAYKPSEKIQVDVYFRVKERPSGDFRLQVEAWAEDSRHDPGKARAGAGRRAAQSTLRFTAEGLFPTSRWRPGEHVRDRFQIAIPATWREGDRITLGLRMAGADGNAKLLARGPTRPGDEHLAVLGTVQLLPAPPPGPAPAAPESPRQAPPKAPLPPSQ
jgi:arylsulfatase A-like enzyme